MRLLNITTCKLEEFINNKKIPLYAILSHTWGEFEITFQDIIGPNPETKAGYEKVENTCSRAKNDGFNYVWIDTCCIDKTSSSELSEAINSMYHWYQDAIICYVYLGDMSSNTINQQTRVGGLEFLKAKWFTRGWTLQELIAPSFIIFFNQKWQEIGSKSSLHPEISEITRIPTDILVRPQSLSSASIAQRMSWASERKTTRDEDLAYCLMGIFGINMPLLYGEGRRAFTRLQEAIMKNSDDYSPFAWKGRSDEGGLLATSPAAFFKSSHIIPIHHSSHASGAITLNNKGIHLSVQTRSDFRGRGFAILPCTEDGKKVAISLKALSEANEYFIRTNSHKLELLEGDLIRQKYCEKIICVPQRRQIRQSPSALARAVENGHEAALKLLLKSEANVEARDDSGRTLLESAANSGHEAVVKLLLEKGASQEVQDESGRLPLHTAALNGHSAVVKVLLENGANIQGQLNSGGGGRGGGAPLVFAARNGHVEVVKLLLEKGADIDGGDNAAWSPLDVAAENGHKAVVKLLLERGAKIGAREDFGQWLQ